MVVKKTKVLITVDMSLLDNLKSVRRSEGIPVSKFFQMAAVERLKRKGFFK